MDGIVLAAGASSRMGVWKLLLPWRGLTVVETVVEEALAACDRVIVVAGHRAEDLVALFGGDARVSVVVHEGWRKGQFSSLQRGLREVNGPFFVTLADMPGVTRHLFAELQSAREQSELSPPRAFRPGSADTPGHPVLFDPEAAPLIRALHPSRSMREVFPRLSVTYLAGSEAAFLDVDVPQDYRPGTLDASRTRCPPSLAAEAKASKRAIDTSQSG